MQAVFSLSVYKISIDQVQRLSYVDQLTLLCILCMCVCFNMKNNFYIDSMDLLYFEKKKKHVIDILHFVRIIIFFKYIFENQNLDLNV